jgi:hypothetical protein
MVLVMCVHDRAVVGGVVVHKIELDGSIVDLSQEVDTTELSLNSFYYLSSIRDLFTLNIM